MLNGAERHGLVGRTRRVRAAASSNVGRSMLDVPPSYISFTTPSRPPDTSPLPQEQSSTMKTMPLILVGLVSSSLSAFSATPPAKDNYVAHEWGTFTSVQCA